MRTPLALLAVLLVAGCGDEDHFRECTTGADCVQAGIPGTCRPSPVSPKNWCSYPDGSCPTPPAERWGRLAGDGLAEQCVAQESPDGGLADSGMPDGSAPDAPAEADASMVDAGSPDAGPPDAGPPSGTYGTPEVVANVNTSDKKERMPSASFDGLELYFARCLTTSTPPYCDIYLATRPTATQPFGTPAVVSAVSTSAGSEIYPSVAPSGLELYFVRDGYCQVSTRSSPTAEWGTPTSLGISFCGAAPSVTLAGTEMYFTDPCMPPASGPCLYRRTRPDTASPWSATREQVTLAAGTPQYAYVTVSPDGHGLLISNPFLITSARAMQAWRSSLAADWSTATPTVINALNFDTSYQDARWYGDLMEIFLSGDTPDSPGLDDIFVSTLMP